MNSENKDEKNIKRSSFWTKANKDVFNLVKEKKIAKLMYLNNILSYI